MIVLSLALAVAAADVRVEVRPERPHIEDAGWARHLNFDFVLQNPGERALRLDEVQVSALDDKGALAARKFVGSGGSSPSIRTLPARDLPAKGTIVVFNPFHTWEPQVPLERLVYEFTFGSEQDESLELKTRVEVAPRPFAQHAELVPPLKGRFLVWDGHDFYAHHRRWDFAHPAFQKLGLHDNGDRYAYDLSLVDASGQMFKGSGEQPEDWFGFGATIYAPGAGTVVEAVSDKPDRGENKVDWDAFPRNPKLAGGNYVIIDHGHGEWSGLYHMKQGSVLVKPGERVRQDQPIGQMGFSGDAITVHLHYKLQAGTAFDAEGLPSTFARYKRVLGTRVLPVAKGAIDTGDIVER